MVLVKNSKSTRNRLAKSAPMSRKLRNETSQIFKLLLYKTTIVQKCPKYKLDTYYYVIFIQKWLKKPFYFAFL